jgi:hypothetical protein
MAQITPVAGRTLKQAAAPVVCSRRPCGVACWRRRQAGGAILLLLLLLLFLRQGPG